MGDDPWSMRTIRRSLILCLTISPNPPIASGLQVLCLPRSGSDYARSVTTGVVRLSQPAQATEGWGGAYAPWMTGANGRAPVPEGRWMEPVVTTTGLRDPNSFCVPEGRRIPQAREKVHWGEDSASPWRLSRLGQPDYTRSDTAGVNRRDAGNTHRRDACVTSSHKSSGISKTNPPLGMRCWNC
jgi:hypothetical protein